MQNLTKLELRELVALGKLKVTLVPIYSNADLSYSIYVETSQGINAVCDKELWQSADKAIEFLKECCSDLRLINVVIKN